MRKQETIKEWCEKNNRTEYLKEILYKDFDENSPIDLNKKIWWICPKCGEILGDYTFEERLKMKKIKCKRCLRTMHRTEDEEISYLCKWLGTSRPEQYIYAYIKSIFPSTIRGKKFDWLLWDAEFDMFIPELTLAIEYDGFHWHKEKYGISDKDKNELARKHNITLFRVREKGLESIDCDYYIYDYNKRYTNIEKPINAIINFINIKYRKNIKLVQNCDFENIKKRALYNLRNEKKGKSVIGVWNEIEKYWDYEQNKELKPEDVRVSDKFILYAKCPYCLENVRFVPRISYRIYGKNSFTPHICKALDEYCISLLRKKCKDGKLELSIDKLDDKRIKDWLIRVAKDRKYLTTIKDDNIFDNIEKKIGFKINWQNLYKLKIANYNDLKEIIKRKT